MKTTVCSLIFLVLCTNAFSFQEANERRQRVEQQSQKFAKAIEVASLTDVVSLFETEATLLPEYHKPLHGTSKIKSYYAQFFAKAESSKFAKEDFELISLGEYFVELGTFEHDYQTPKGTNFEYDGKYVTYWKFDEEGTPYIRAHIWGASNYFEAENVNFISIDVPESTAIVANTRWEKEIEKVRKFAYDAVFSGDSEKQLTTYTEDATYMTYYDPPFMGKEEIAAYFRSHYNPEVPMDSLMTKSVKVIDMGEHALKFGEYYVAWTWEGQPSYIEGKGLTLYKRMEDGSIKIYRQMINHSMPATPKK